MIQVHGSWIWITIWIQEFLRRLFTIAIITKNKNNNAWRRYELYLVLSSLQQFLANITPKAG